MAQRYEDLVVYLQSDREADDVAWAVKKCRATYPAQRRKSDSAWHSVRPPSSTSRTRARTLTYALRLCPAPVQGATLHTTETHCSYIPLVCNVAFRYILLKEK